MPDDVPIGHRHRLGHLYVVADGMGGLAAGAQASALVVSTIFDAFYGNDHSRRSEALAEAVRAANAALVRLASRLQESGDLSEGLGSTVVAAVTLNGGFVVVAHVGDSRAYLVEPAGVRPLTADHTLVAELMARGALTPAEASSHPARRQLSRALGRSEDVSVDVAVHRLEIGDRLVLMSDGAYGAISDEELGKLVRRRRAGSAAQTLCELLERRDPSDDATVVVIDPFAEGRG